MGHINISVDNVTTEVVVQGGNANDAPPTPYGDDDTSAFAWHKDSYPFVCVTMLSDCTGMVGGETAIRMGNGEVMKARGPTMVRSPTPSVSCPLFFLTCSFRVLPWSCRADTSSTRLSRL